MNDQIEIRAYTAKVSDLPSITALSNVGASECDYQQWVKDVIPMPEGLCMVLIARTGSYPFMVNEWRKNMYDYLPEIKQSTDADNKRWEERRKWEEERDKK